MNYRLFLSSPLITLALLPRTALTTRTLLPRIAPGSRSFFSFFRPVDPEEQKRKDQRQEALLDTADSITEIGDSLSPSRSRVSWWDPPFFSSSSSTSSPSSFSYPQAEERLIQQEPPNSFWSYDREDSGSWDDDDWDDDDWGDCGDGD